MYSVSELVELGLRVETELKLGFKLNLVKNRILSFRLSFWLN